MEKIDKLKKKNILTVLIALFFLIVFICIIWLLLNKKTENYYNNQRLLYKEIVSTDNDDKSYQFKGDATNNYLVYNNLLWRIIRVNKSGSLTIILDKPINYLPKTIDIVGYLNEEFLPELDKSKLVPNNLCADDLSSDIKTECKKIDKNLVSLLDEASFYKTIGTSSNFITDNVDTMWLLNNINGEEKGFHVSKQDISFSSFTNYYAIKPVITLSRIVLYETGDGTKNNPYLISSNKPTIGSIVKIDNDEYTVISTKNDYKLLANKRLNAKELYDNVIDYLNNKFYNSLSYNVLLTSGACLTTKLSKDKITKEDSNNKICMPNLLDFKLIDEQDYYMNAYADNYYLVYDNGIVYGTANKKHSIVPVIAIDNNSKFLNENGTYILEK